MSPISLEHLTRQALRQAAKRGGIRQEEVELVDGLHLIAHATPSPIDASLYEPVICLILRGRKQVAIGARTLSFGPGEYLLVSHDLPVRSRVTLAPYLALVLTVNVAIVRRLYDEIAEPMLESGRTDAIATARADGALIDAMDRYLALADSPADAKVLGPLVLKELHYRLLTASIGGMLRCLLRHDSDASAIARAIGHIRGDLRATIAIPLLARRVGMSVSSFHKHFKAVTATTPRQYQKALRLLEARRRLTTEGASVTAAALDVGYESPSQFSRDYARKFGRPPSHDRAN